MHSGHGEQVHLFEVLLKKVQVERDLYSNRENYQNSIHMDFAV